MKCEHCGKNEVTFVYQSNINGKVEEKHLCSECAEKLGYTQRLAAQNQRMMQNFFGGSLFGSSFFDDFFTPMPSLMGRMLEDPFDDFFADMPALSAAPAQKEEQEPQKQDTLVGQEEQSWFAYQRQMNALKLEMKKAVHQENFERAAELRDQIRSLEAQHKESK
ncbi:UvrB/UvrC motif-containing protein [uncultured Dysosmobacter sp.]|uniref:UvrB/UvrC motif-containing protein n=1 Tax=uncultured Dysosmobacter sp. TaxID=2591384 RepID=UPI00261994BF|nr:UvrB/UvrC motif-containing protein [uncultured Dysosmobacter sp.]